MKILITGGAGFIGSNLAARFIKKHKVTVFDSLEREGSERNISWLSKLAEIDKRPRTLKFVKGEITDKKLVGRLVRGADVVLHLAAQVAVTSSIVNPRRDFEVNALGTFNILEAARLSYRKPLVVYSSTNKVYGKIAEEGLREEKTRFTDTKNPNGIDENQPLDFYSPYGCSKGGADAYVRDYGRIYGLSTVVLRKSCIYGVRQFGTEDQGWVAHFVRQALNGKPITIYGNGKQVRDLLYIDDLVALYKRIVDEFARQKEALSQDAIAYQERESFCGGVFNVGGGERNAVSLLELVGLLEGMLGRKIKLRFAAWRPGDQRVYISNISEVKKVFNWHPKVGVREGLKRLVNWAKREF